MAVFKAYYLSPIGPVEISGTPEGILSVGFVSKQLPNERDLPECVKEAIRQVDEYFRGARKSSLSRCSRKARPFKNSYGSS